MSYGKDDFLHWDDDIDLDSLLGDYTCSENEITDDDEPLTKKKKNRKQKKKVKSDNSENSAKAKTYNCSECTNSYASISGLRGHLRKKKAYGITNAKGKEAIQYFDLVYFIVRFFFLSIFPKMTFYQVFSCNVFTMFNEHVN